MSTATIGGPAFQIESDRAIIGLGNSERKQVGELWVSTLWQLEGVILPQMQR